MGKEGIIGLEEFDFWLKPWKKQKGTEEEITNNPVSRSASHRKDVNIVSSEKTSFVREYYDQ